MKRVFVIPQMMDEEISGWSKSIRPIVGDGIYYLRELSKKELTSIAYTWLKEPWDYTCKVDYTKLSILEDRKMLHKYDWFESFKPTVGEVICQIPNDYLYLKKVIAFQILDGPIAMDTTFIRELNAGFHVSIVHLYQAKDSTNQKAQLVKEYPYMNIKVPVGMTREEFVDAYGLKKKRFIL